MASSVVVLPAALADIDEATLFIAAQGSPERASRWREGVLDRIGELVYAPESRPRAPESEELGIELRQFHFHSHRVIFRVAEDIVEVLRVYHDARRELRQDDLP